MTAKKTYKPFNKPTPVPVDADVLFDIGALLDFVVEIEECGCKELGVKTGVIGSCPYCRAIRVRKALVKTLKQSFMHQLKTTI